MTISKTWKLVISSVLALFTSPFVGAFIESLYNPYAASNDELTTVFEISTLVVFPILTALIFSILNFFFKALIS